MKVYRGDWRSENDRDAYNRGKALSSIKVHKYDFFFEDEIYSGCKMNKYDDVSKGTQHRDKVLISMIHELLNAMGFKDQPAEKLKFLKEHLSNGIILKFKTDYKYDMITPGDYYFETYTKTESASFSLA